MLSLLYHFDLPNRHPPGNRHLNRSESVRQASAADGRKREIRQIQARSASEWITCDQIHSLSTRLRFGLVWGIK